MRWDPLCFFRKSAYGKRGRPVFLPLYRQIGLIGDGSGAFFLQLSNFITDDVIQIIFGIGDLVGVDVAVLYLTTGTSSSVQSAFLYVSHDCADLSLFAFGKMDCADKELTIKSQK